MSDFLTLVQDLHRESGASGVAPTTIENQTGENLRMVNWIARADQYVQNLWTRWKYLRFEYVGVTVASQRDVVKPGTIKTWDNDTFFIGGDPIEAVHYNSVKREVFDLTFEDTPWRIIIMPNGDLRYDPIPNAIFNITADAYLLPVPLTSNAQVSLIPEQFHNVILGRGLILYGNYENAPEIIDQGQDLYSDLEMLESAHLMADTDDVRHVGQGGFFEVIAE